jgi:hypothetical protein
LLVAACAARPSRGRAPAIELPAKLPFIVSPDGLRKLSPYLVTQWRDHGIARGEHTPVVVTINGSANG